MTLEEQLATHQLVHAFTAATRATKGVTPKAVVFALSTLIGSAFANSPRDRREHDFGLFNTMIRDVVAKIDAMKEQKRSTG